MAYADYEFYTTRYFGDELTEATAPKLLQKKRRRQQSRSRNLLAISKSGQRPLK